MLLTSNKDTGLNPSGGGMELMTALHSTAQSLSLSHSMVSILLNVEGMYNPKLSLHYVAKDIL